MAKKGEWKPAIVDFIIVFGLSWFFYNTLPMLFVTLQGDPLGALSFGLAILIYLLTGKKVLRLIKM